LTLYVFEELRFAVNAIDDFKMKMWCWF